MNFTMSQKLRRASVIKLVDNLDSKSNNMEHLIFLSTMAIDRKNTGANLSENEYLHMEIIMMQSKISV
jgi:hypothetical protein